jgi:CubicO group peptidase (beta-lactamase class C family)
MPMPEQDRSEIDCSALTDAAQREIDEGLTACQVAVARAGEVVYSRSFGSATQTTRFWVASATKPIVSSAIWILMAEGLVDISKPVAHYVPEFAENGKQAVTVEQVMLMTSGFPDAPMPSDEGGNPESRAARMASWTLETEPGSAYAYHGTSAHWVLAEIIERTTGEDFRDFVERRITGPIGLGRVLGIPRAAQGDVAQTSPAASDAVRDLFDHAAKIEVGEPGGGAVMTADQLALFYQALLHDPAKIWDPEILADATHHVRCTLPDPLMGMPANRTLGVVIGAGFGTTWGSSETAFGWPGHGGQIGFAEPATGLSFAFLQMGSTDQIEAFVRGMKMSALALALGR